MIHYRRIYVLAAFMALLAGCVSSEDNSDIVFQPSSGQVDSPGVAMSGSGRGLIAFQSLPGRLSGADSSVLGVSYSIEQGLGSVLATGGRYIGFDLNAHVAMDSQGRGLTLDEDSSGCGDPAAGMRRVRLHSRDHDPASGWAQPATIVAVIHECTSLALLERDLAVDAAGNALAIWAVQGNQDNLFAAHRLAGGAWSSPVQLNSPLSGSMDAAEGRIAMNPAGDALVIYKIQPKAAGIQPGQLFAHTFDFVTGFGPAVRLDDDAKVASADVAIDGAGNGLAVWNDDGSSDDAVPLSSRRYLAGTGWTAERSIIGDTYSSLQLRVGLDHAGNGMVVFKSVGEGELEAVPYRNGEWLGAQRLTLASDVDFQFALVVAPPGDATVVLTQGRGDVPVSVAYRRFHDLEFDPALPGSGWQPLTTIEAPVDRVQTPVPVVAMESRSSALAVWASHTKNADNSFNPSQIRTFVWAPPVAVFDASADRLTVSVAASTSRARTTGQDIVGYQWDFENDGVFDATGLQSQNVYPAAGTYAVRLRVTDGAGISAEAIQAVTVSTNAAPPPPMFTLDVTSTSGSGAGRVTSEPGGIDCGFGNNACSEDFAPGTVVTLTQTAGTNSRFDAWRGDADCTDGNVTMNANKLCEAVFVADGGGGTTFALTFLNIVGRGHVETGDARIFCPGGACTATYAPGATSQVNAVLDEGALLEDWGGDCNSFGAQPSFSVVMDRDITCTAVFASR